MSDVPDLPAPDPVVALQQRLAESQQRLVQAELKSHAIRAGIIDLDCLKLLDPAGLALDEQGGLPEAPAALARLKQDKPWLFTAPNSSHPAPPPAPEPARLRLARDMNHAEWRAARERLVRGR